jgi:hypothetical protein
MTPTTPEPVHWRSRVTIIRTDGRQYAHRAVVPAGDAADHMAFEMERGYVETSDPDGTIVILPTTAILAIEFEDIDETGPPLDRAPRAKRPDPWMPRPWGDLDVVDVRFPEDQWHENDALEDPTVALNGPILVINGLPMHLEAWAVHDDHDGIQQADDYYAEDYEKLHEAVHADGAFTTATIRGREYIVVASPHC